MKMGAFFRRNLFFAFFLIVCGQVFAQNGIFDRTGIIPGHGSYSSVPEESVDLFTGNVTLCYLDYRLPGPNGLDVEIWRVYNSKFSPQAEPKSWVGLGWTLHMGRVHNYTTTTPVIEFPDGRWETAWPDNYPGVGKNITRDFVKYDRTTNRLYFQNGVVWTFNTVRTITKPNGSTESVRLVDKIENSYGHSINILYDSVPSAYQPSIDKITDSMGRVIDFESTGMTYKKLSRMKVKNATGAEVVYSYTVSEFPNGYHKLTSFAPPRIPATTFDYNDGTNDRYELTKVTTSYGGMLEFIYADHAFYFNGTLLNSRVASQKKITFNPDNPGEQAKVWSFAYPSYNGVPAATATVQGPEYSTSVTSYGYDASCPWKIGLISVRFVGDGSRSETFDWTYQQISNSTWSVLGTNMGTAKGPLLSSVVRPPLGDASIKEEFLYERTGTKRYGIPTRIKYFINGASSPKNYRDISYNYELSAGFLSRYMLQFPSSEKQYSGGGVLLKEKQFLYFEETGKWGAVKQVAERKSADSWSYWKFGYSSTDPKLIVRIFDPPGYVTENKTSIHYSYGVNTKVETPYRVEETHDISQYNSSIVRDWYPDGVTKIYAYDDLGRLESVDIVDDNMNDVSYDWPSNRENKLVIGRGGNTITKYWDGMGRDTGSTETGDNTTLYFRKTLDAEGRIKEENRASINPDHKFVYSYNAAGLVTQIANPVGKVTRISYSGNTKTVTDAENRVTTYEHSDLPGLVTKLTDAQGHVANYAYDPVGRLATADINGTRNQSYTYNGIDNVLAETHPETGTISYSYNGADQISQRAWYGTTLSYSYNSKGGLASKSDGSETVNYEYNDAGRLSDITSTNGWSRSINFGLYDSVTSERLTIPGLSTKFISYFYDGNMNLKKITYPDGKIVDVTNNGLDAPETMAFNGTSLVSAVSYGAGKAPAVIAIQGNGTTYSAAYDNAGLPTSVSLTKGATTLYNAAYTYDGVGNILGISSTAPSPGLSATFAYDSLNRLTSAAYNSGRAASYSYEYDEYGNMRTARENGLAVFTKTYDAGNRMVGSSYDTRGNLLSSGANLYYWDNQNRLSFLTNLFGTILAKYLYDDNGMRIRALPAEPEVGVQQDGIGVADGSGFVDFYAGVGSDDSRTLTISNIGDANLVLSGTPIISISGPNAGDFSVTQNPSSVITPLGSSEFVIKFRPQSAGAKTAYVSIATNDFDENPYNFELRGYMGPPDITVSQGQEFGSCPIGSSVVASFYIDNDGGAPLYLTGVDIGGTDVGDFELDSQPNSTIQPGEYTTFDVRFTPHNPAGGKTAIIIIHSNDPDENPYELAIGGEALERPQGMGLAITSPNGGESLKPGSAQSIIWSGDDSIKDVKLEYSLDNGSTFQTISERTRNNGRFPWQAPFVISPSCLVRVSNADGYPLRPEVVSWELKFKVGNTTDPDAQSAHFRVRLSMPDMKSQSLRSAELAFHPDPLEGMEYIVFNQTQVKYQEIMSFHSAWHRLQILYDLNAYVGTLLLDGQVVLKDVMFEVGPWTNSLAEISIFSDRESTAAVWIDDLEFKLQDAGFGPGDKSGNTLFLIPVAREGFEGHRREEFPSIGGFVTRQELLTESDSLPVVDSYERAEGNQSLRLKGKEGVPALIVKRFALPVRFPFDTSDGNFAITNERRNESGAVMSSESAEEFGRTRAGDNERARDRSKRRHRAAKKSYGDDNQANRQASSRNSVHQNTAGADAGVRALSGASAYGGSFYIYSMSGRLLAEYNGLDQCVKDYIYLGNQLLAEHKPQEGKTYFYTTDQINSTRIVTDETGAVVYSVAHDPYGGIQRIWANSFDPAPKFSGKERDTESGLDCFGARYYDKSLYRFLSASPNINFINPLRAPEFWNLYAYGFNNPISILDHDGYKGFHLMVSGYKLSTRNRQGQMDGAPKEHSHDPRDSGDVLNGLWKWTSITEENELWKFQQVDKLLHAILEAMSSLDDKDIGKCLNGIKDYFSNEGYSQLGNSTDSFLSWWGIVDDPSKLLADWEKEWDKAGHIEWLLGLSRGSFFERIFKSLMLVPLR